MLIDHEHKVIFALHSIDSLGFVDDTILIILNLLHHRRTLLVQMINVCLILLLHSLLVLFLEHGCAQVQFLLLLAILLVTNHLRHLIIEINHILRQLHLFIELLTILSVLIDPLLNVSLRFIHLPELSSCIRILLRDLPLLLILCIVFERVDHVPQIYLIFRVYLVCAFGIDLILHCLSKLLRIIVTCRTLHLLVIFHCWVRKCCLLGQTDHPVVTPIF